MFLRDPILLTLLGGAVATVVVLIDRRLRSRLNAMDAWAARRSLSCERAPPLAVLAPLEPLSVVPEVVAIERMIQGVLRTPEIQTGATLLACVTGNRRRGRRFLVGIFASHPDLPTLRLLPESDPEAPDNLGYVPMPAGALPQTYRLESFQPLPRALMQALSSELQTELGGFRVELRPGRLILAVPSVSVEKLDEMVELSLRLQRAMRAALEGPPPPEEPGPAGGLLN